MVQLESLLKQRADLDSQIREMQQSERQDAIRKIRELVAMYNIDVFKDLGPAGAARKQSAVKGTSVAVKYRNAATGDTWTGRGLKPKWLRQQLEEGKQLDDFKA